ncbi:MAG TPA: winged helix-turn-helix domain-containing protein [Terriglobales bacterium]|nr:winged helix-turn-helix domain-containing protein [Terriglobales bacterium]
MATSQNSRPQTLGFGVFEADLATGELRKSGRRLRVQEQPFQILTILAQRPGELVTREELVTALWPEGTFVDYDHSLNTAVNKLREALGDSATTPRYIETLPRRGYRFLGAVTLKPERAEATSHLSSDAVLPRPNRGAVRILFLLAQLMYLGFYVAALSKIERVHAVLVSVFGAAADPIAGAIVVTALIGIPVRFFLLTAVGFDYQAFGKKYELIFSALLVLDEFWALAPLLMAPKIGTGMALAITAALLYLPFGQRTLVRMSY